MQFRLFSLTLLVSAFLLFLIQPMVARFLLPSWGGGSGVWSVCLLFFQTALLLGYVYAYLLTRYVSRRTQGIVHGLALLASLAGFSLHAIETIGQASSAKPELHLLWVLANRIGLPCVLIAASAPLLQSWLAHDRGRSAYRLYAVSNLGSLAGLLSYPLIVEPLLGLSWQARLWNGGYLGFLALVLASTALFHPKNTTETIKSEPKSPNDIATRLLWLAFSAFGVALLLSITTEITTNLLPMPLLWAVPLALYLLTFIWCFKADATYSRRRWLAIFSLTILPTLWLPAIQPLVGEWPGVILCGLALFSGCMVCHGELAAAKPDTSSLGLYYVYLAAGGAAGSVFVNFAAPWLFARHWELAVSLFGIFALAGLAIIIERTQAIVSKRQLPLDPAQRRNAPIGIGVVSLWVVIIAAFAAVGTMPLRSQRGTVAAARSFYGALSVVDTASPEGGRRSLLHGRIRHGAQNLGEERRSEPTLYYTLESGIGLVLNHAAYQALRHIGVIGLGVGTLATYGRKGDRIRFYELDPLVETFARSYFTFLADSQANIDVVIGDGRLALRDEIRNDEARQFDVLIIDAFNADSVPTHLLTHEAFELYWRHLDRDGTLAFNTTNSFLDLSTVAAAHARAAGKHIFIIKDKPGETSRSGSTWVLVTGNSALSNDNKLRSRAVVPGPGEHAIWTDDYSNILSTLQ